MNTTNTVTVTAGEGGDDARQFAEQLTDIIETHLSRNNQQWERDGTELHIVEPPSWLEHLAGGHRIQRTQPDERRQSSTVIVTVDTPTTISNYTADDIERDVTIDTYTASGPGGQHRNRTRSAVRATHQPTGLVVHATTHRSQHRNRRHALEELARRLNEHDANRNADVNAARRQIRRRNEQRTWTWTEWRNTAVHEPTGTKLSYELLNKGRGFTKLEQRRTRRHQRS